MTFNMPQQNICLADLSSHSGRPSLGDCHSLPSPALQAAQLIYRGITKMHFLYNYLRYLPEILTEYRRYVDASVCQV